MCRRTRELQTAWVERKFRVLSKALKANLEPVKNMRRIWNLSVSWIFALACLAGTACNYDGVGAVACESGEVSEGRECVDGYWVSTGPSDDLDMDVTDMRDDEPDVRTDLDEVDMGGDADMEDCTPEDDDVFCARLMAACGRLEAPDNCGVDRVVESCGPCGTDENCTRNECVCEPETNEEFCARLGKDCGGVTDFDNCGVERQDIDCGVCDGEEVCGEQAPNVCGCPCNIDGTCFPAGTVNSENQCEFCDPDTNATGWTPRLNQACNSGDLCTVNAICNEQAQCVGEEKDCRSEDSNCETGQCNPMNGNCFAVIDAGACRVDNTCYNEGDPSPVNECQACITSVRQEGFSPRPNGETCAGDGKTCTTSTCQSGMCANAVQSDTCLIGGDCFNSNETRPGNVCEACIVAESQTDWSDNDGVVCDDGIACTGDGMCTGGSCQDGTVDTGCRIAQMCVADGAFQTPDMCDVCDPGVDTADWTRLAPGEDCEDDGLSCTDNLCAADGKCEAQIQPDTCLIDGVCYGPGDLNPNGDGCQECDPDASQSQWTDVDGETTDACQEGACSCQTGVCRNPGGNAC